METEKLTIEHLAAYLPYGLKMFNTKAGRIIDVRGLSVTVDGYVITATVKKGNIFMDCDYQSDLWPLKPILRPMSRLFYWMDNTEKSYYDQIKTETGVDVDSDFSFDKEIEYRGTHRFDLVPILATINFLFKHHFDVFGLIEKGLAIDINTIEQK